MRLRVEIDASVDLGERDGPRKCLLAVPADLRLVGDLLYHLHHSRQLKPQPLVLALDGFALLPSQPLHDVLRDGDVVSARRAWEGRPSKRRKVAPPMMAILDRSPSKAQPRASAVSQEPQDCLITSAAAAAAARAALAAARSPRPALPFAPATATTSQEPLGDFHLEQRSTSTGPVVDPSTTTPVVGEMPDPSQNERWRPVARLPLPGEFIRFREVGVGRLSDYQSAKCESLETIYGTTYLRLNEVGRSRSVPFDQLLQVSVLKVEKLEGGASPRKAGERSRRGGKSGGKVAAPMALTDGHGKGGPARPPIAKEPPVPTEAAPLVGGAAVPHQGSEEVAMEPSRAEVDGSPVRQPADALEEPSPLKPAVASTESAAPGAQERGLKRWKPEPLYEPPETSSLSEEELLELQRKLREQVEFYFGRRYASDSFLLSQADNEGWTSLRLVAKFNRMRELTKDFQLVQQSLAESSWVELSPCWEYVRCTQYS